ncbi:hypothetical protein FNV65_06360 [Streptomyces sp. S1A1-8]|uniref:hypothetical protein n=1 Tax=unclassified Streptomyces TaxID=2593676 RepID=UPI001164D5FC|nr:MULTISPECIES: hypothetical protein [unclassified Streptomyces]QDN75770.1 hypothetical protein FNV64_09355 [Streptomyces sp. S1A1-7]QDN85419.1 hypothetical protein FNV61_06940 [Streptomyces sp. RLB3-6]QDN95978.1 hypothetical protein FNV58_07790 [Streptomyces sp. RLB1-9]QDO06272.1 hypothetical protein FNV68_08385 [Streptomyces sp. S1D4-23]QDO17699.1 hypothetical protein FNV65_06360 [Streptomyces sp. S1A1-8]
MRRNLRQRRPTGHPGLTDGLVTALTPTAASQPRSRGPHRSGLTLVRRSRATALLGGITLFAVALLASVAWFAPDTGSAQGASGRAVRDRGRVHAAARRLPVRGDIARRGFPALRHLFGSLLACADHRRRGDGGTGRPTKSGKDAPKQGGKDKH